jgi:hypothetical protein
MRNQLIISLGILLIASISAMNLTADEPYSFDLGEVYSYYEITGNSTEVDLNVFQEGTIVTIIPDKYMKDDNFTITFYNEDQEVIFSSGGSSGGWSFKEHWDCGEWSECLNGVQTRTCYYPNNLIPEKIEKKECIPDFVPLFFEGENQESANNLEYNEFQEKIGSKITGAVIGLGKTKIGAGLIIGIIIILIGIIVLALQKNK